MEINNMLKVEVAKNFPVSPAQLYLAWTEPEQLKQWWKPMGNSLKDVTNDIRKGGTVSYVFENNTLIISGEYLEVNGKEKLVYTWKWELPEDAVRNSEYKLSVEFKGNAGGSEIHVLQENFENEESMLPHQQGWEKGLSDLEQFLKQSSTTSATPQDDASGMPTVSEGYREDPNQVKVGGG